MLSMRSITTFHQNSCKLFFRIHHFLFCLPHAHCFASQCQNGTTTGMQEWWWGQAKAVAPAAVAVAPVLASAPAPLSLSLCACTCVFVWGGRQELAPIGQQQSVWGMQAIPRCCLIYTHPPVQPQGPKHRGRCLFVPALWLQSRSACVGGARRSSCHGAHTQARGKLGANGLWLLWWPSK